MIAGLDSSVAPTTPDVAFAAAAGVSLWSGYLATRSEVNLLTTWTQRQFETARFAGGTPIGFCSGLDDPAAVRELAQAWNVRACLDVEDGIRGDGPWVQAWLDTSGAGLYGLADVHQGRRARFHVVANYPAADPGTSWPPWLERPATPLGWQWQGTHLEFGLPVDRGNYDDWFGTGGEAPMILTVERPDGGRDVYAVVDAHVEHTVLDFGGQITFRDTLPGSWSVLIAAGYRGTLPYVQGLGTDAGHTAFEVTDPGPGWVLALKP